mgnify:CR=1 FL=1
MVDSAKGAIFAEIFAEISAEMMSAPSMYRSASLLPHTATAALHGLSIQRVTPPGGAAALVNLMKQSGLAPGAKLESVWRARYANDAEMTE